MDVITDRAPAVSVVACSPAKIWNVHRGHHELEVDIALVIWLATAFDEHRPAI